MRGPCVAALFTVLGAYGCGEDEGGSGDTALTVADAGDGTASDTESTDDGGTADDHDGGTGDGTDGGSTSNGEASGTGDTGGTGTGTTGASGDLSAPQGLFAVPAKEAVGLEWDPVEGATGYNIYWDTQTGVTPASGQLMGDVTRNVIHDGLTDGTTYYYVVTAEDAGGESAPSPEISGTPRGPFVLDHFGNGDTDALIMAGGVHAPIEHRNHVLLLGDGYLQNELDTYAVDTADYIEEIFDVSVFSEFQETFVIWSYPVASNEHTPGDTILDMDDGRAGSQTEGLLWDIVDQFAYAPTEFNGSGARNLVVGIMVLDPSDGESGFSGYTTTMRDPDDNSKRLRVGVAHGRSHEFAHAFAYVSDEYYDVDHGSGGFDETSNLWGDTACSGLPWAHLLHGSAINPDTDELVGAFGASDRVHSELRCLLNGGHDNADLFGGNGNLRVYDRMCNWCRELTAYRIYEALHFIGDDINGWDQWKSAYRPAFWETYGFRVPSPVPQENSQGQSFFQACD